MWHIRQEIRFRPVSYTHLDNEKEHAKLWFKELNGIGDTSENLLSAAEGENYEWTDMYDGFAKTADEEGWLLYTSHNAAE